MPCSSHWRSFLQDCASTHRRARTHTNTHIHTHTYTHTHTHTHFLLLLFISPNTLPIFHCCRKEWYVCVPAQAPESTNRTQSAMVQWIGDCQNKSLGSSKRATLRHSMSLTKWLNYSSDRGTAWCDLGAQVSWDNLAFYCPALCVGLTSLWLLGESV